MNPSAKAHNVVLLRIKKILIQLTRDASAMLSVLSGMGADRTMFRGQIDGQ